MSALSRMCLRFAACAALRAATLAGDAVQDSMIAATHLTDEQPIAAAIAVYTEQEDADALSEQQGGPPFLAHVELALEITMQARALEKDEYIVGIPSTDDELETTLDLIEAQAEFALFESLASAAVLFRRIARRAKSKQSLRFTDPKSGEKLAKRYVIFKIETPDFGLPVERPGDAPRVGLARLPEPFAAIAAAWPDGLAEKEKALAVARALALNAPPAFLAAVSTAAPRPLSPTPPSPTPAPNLRKETWTMSDE